MQISHPEPSGLLASKMLAAVIIRMVMSCACVCRSNPVYGITGMAVSWRLRLSGTLSRSVWTLPQAVGAGFICNNQHELQQEDVYNHRVFCCGTGEPMCSKLLYN